MLSCIHPKACVTHMIVCSIRVFCICEGCCTFCLCVAIAYPNVWDNYMIPVLCVKHLICTECEHMHIITDAILHTVPNNAYKSDCHHYHLSICISVASMLTTLTVYTLANIYSCQFSSHITS